MLRFSLLLCLCCVLQAAPAFGAARKKIAPKPIDYHDTVITSVDATSIVIDQNHVSKTYAITPTTEITFRGQRAAVADLKPGMAVSVTMDTAPGVAARVTANPPPIHPAQPADPGKKK